MKCRILQTTEAPKSFWSVCLFSVLILKMPKHLPSPSEKEQDPSMYGCVSVLHKPSSQICVGRQLLVVSAQLSSCWAARESSGTPTCQPSAPGTQHQSSLAPLQAGSILILGTDLLGFSHLLSARALSFIPSLQLETDWAAGLIYALSKCWGGSLIISEVIFTASDNFQSFVSSVILKIQVQQSRVGTFPGSQAVSSAEVVTTEK